MKKVIIILIAITTAFAGFAQTGKNKMPAKKAAVTQQVKYTCPMHPNVTSDKPRKCSECGMDLTKSKKEQMKMEVMKMYACPMHPDVTSDKPGKCSQCNMDMTEVKKKPKIKKG